MQTENLDAVTLALTRRMVADGSARSLREVNGLSLSEVARAIGTSAATIWRWEHLERVPRGDLAIRYGALLADLSGYARAKP